MSPMSANIPSLCFGKIRASSLSIDYSLLRLIHGCLKPYSGVILFLGSITRHFSIKSIKSSSPSAKMAFRIGTLRSRDPLGIPLLLDLINLRLESKKFLLFRHLLIMSSGGIPMRIMKYSRSSCSSIAGKRGLPVVNSAKMHPKDHISTA